ELAVLAEAERLQAPAQAPSRSGLHAHLLQPLADRFRDLGAQPAHGAMPDVEKVARGLPGERCELAVRLLGIGKLQLSDPRRPERNDVGVAGGLVHRPILDRRKMLVAKAGIEPATHGFSVRCSTN